MKRGLSFILAAVILITAVCLLPVGASAAEKEIAPTGALSGTVGDCSWTLNGTVLIISGNGPMADCDVGTPFVGTAGDSVTDVIITDGVTGIGSRAFDEWLSIRSVTISDTVKHIDSFAFYHCTTLENVRMSRSVETIGSSAFCECSLLEEIELPDTLQSIGSDAFASCEALKELTIPDSVTSIGRDAFRRCTSLEKLKLSGSLTTIDYETFNYCTKLERVEIPDSVTTINGSAFSGCTELDEITFTDSVTQVDSYAFYRTEWLEKQPDGLIYIGRAAYQMKGVCPEEVEIREGTVSISPSAFEGKSSLQKITFADTVESIGAYAFEDCSGLTAVKIPESCTYIGTMAFYSARKLSEISVPASVVHIASKAFTGTAWESAQPTIIYINNVLYRAKSDCPAVVVVEEGTVSISDSAFDQCRFLERITLPDSLTDIYNNAFFSCAALSEVVFSDKAAVRIDAQAFNGCKGLKDITIGNAVVSIGEYAFKNCENLERVFIGDAVTEIGRAAFYNCAKLAELRLPGSLESIGGAAFQGCRSLPEIILPDSDHPTVIDTQAFYGCENAARVYLGSGVTSVGSAAFSGCTALADLTIGSAVTTIGDSAFRDCRNLTSVTIPASVERIGSSAFHYCPSLTSVTIGNALIIGDNAFCDCESLTTVSLGESLALIGGYAFDSCTELKSITIPDTVSVIGTRAFRDCGLTEVVLPASLTEIGNAVFSGCDALVSVEIPSSVRNIRISAFSGCSSLKDVYYHGLEELWKEIAIEDYNEPLENAEIHYLNVSVPFTADYRLSFTDKTKLQCEYLVGGELPLRDITARFVIDNSELSGSPFTVYVNNKKIDGCTWQNGDLVVPLGTAVSGSITVVFRRLPSSLFRSVALLDFDSDQGKGCCLLGKTEYNEGITIQAPAVVGSEVIHVKGETIPDRTVDLYVDDEKAATVQADKAGNYAAQLEIGAFLMPDHIYHVRAEYTDAFGICHTAECDVRYEKNYPELVEFTMTYRGRDYDLLGNGKQNITFILVAYGGNYPFTFKIRFRYPVTGQVYVTSTRRDIVKLMGTQKQDDCTYIAEGFFEPYEDDYVPGVLELVVCGGYSFENGEPAFEDPSVIYHGDPFYYCLDPSGYVYAGLESERVYDAEVKAYYIPYDSETDDDSFWDEPDESRQKLWDASEYAQENPVLTTLDGDYAWDVPEGWWRLEVSKEGYRTAVTDWMPVPPPQLDVNIGLTTTTAPQIESAVLNDGAVTLTFLHPMKPESLKGLTVKDADGTQVAYTLDYTAEDAPDGTPLAKTFVLKLNAGGKKYTIAIPDAENYSGVKGAVSTVVSGRKILGDVDGDDTVTIIDATWIQRDLAGLPNEGYDASVADVDGDLDVSIVDATGIQRSLAGLDCPPGIGLPV